MDDLIIKKTCERCSGEGTIPTGGIHSPGSPAACPRCLGEGFVEDSFITNLATILDNFDVKLDALESHLDTIETKVEALE